jgi:hypothetical protein
MSQFAFLQGESTAVFEAAAKAEAAVHADPRTVTALADIRGSKASSSYLIGSGAQLQRSASRRTGTAAVRMLPG